MFFQLPMNEELTWDNGTPFPEPCIDRIADTVGKVTTFHHLGYNCCNVKYASS